MPLCTGTPFLSSDDVIFLGPLCPGGGSQALTCGFRVVSLNPRALTDEQSCLPGAESTCVSVRSRFYNSCFLHFQFGLYSHPSLHPPFLDNPVLHHSTLPLPGHSVLGARTVEAPGCVTDDATSQQGASLLKDPD